MHEDYAGLMRPRNVFILSIAAAGGIAIIALRHGRGLGQHVPGGIVIGDAALYDVMSHRLLLGSLFDRVATDVAAAAPEGGKVLEVGCGPGRLSVALAERGLAATGLDLDPAMVGRARSNAGKATLPADLVPTFTVGNVASLPFPDASFDVVVSTLSMHHWDDPRAGLSEIGRVLRPGGRALVWDLRAGGVPFHRDVPDPLGIEPPPTLELAGATPWRWPLGLKLTHRIELARIG
jgi:SAM-dependent methyltransferase